MTGLLANVLRNFCTSAGLLTAAGAETVYDLTVIIDYCVNGVAATKGTVVDGTTPVLDGNTGAAFVALQADKGCAFIWSMNVSGTVQLSQGDIQSIDPDTDLFIRYPQFPPVPADDIAFAYMIVKTTGASSAWTVGASNWNATGLSVAISDVFVMPDRPQIA